MATRSRTSFQKRQKEILRMEKQRDKVAKRVDRKLNPKSDSDDIEAPDLNDYGLDRLDMSTLEFPDDKPVTT
jgi:hypothetical protein